MKVRNTVTIKFNQELTEAVIRLTPKKQIRVGKDMVFGLRYGWNYSGYHIMINGKRKSLPSKVMKRVSRYLVFVHKEPDFDYFKIDFENFHW